MVLTIGLTYNVKKANSNGQACDISAEYDDEYTISSIKDSFESRGHAVKLIEADDNMFEKIRSSGADIIFNIAEGVRGESRESHVPAICEMLGIPYTGSGPLTLAICLDKARTKEILNYYNIPTAKHQVFKTPEDELDKNLKYPLIVKPIHEGSSIGVGVKAVARSNRELVDRVCEINIKYNQPALVEKFLPGREFTVAVIGNTKPYALPVVEIYLSKYPKKTKGVYSYEAKTIWENDSLSGPPVNITPEFDKDLKSLAVRSHAALGCRDFSRVDIRLDENDVAHVIEVNPLPGLNPKVEAVSYFPKAGRLAGLSYEDLINEMLQQGIERNKLAERLSGNRIENAIQSRISV